MINIFEKLTTIWRNVDYPFLIIDEQEIRFSDISKEYEVDITNIKCGEVVAIIGDINPSTILTLLRLIDLGVIVVPLTVETSSDHQYYFDTANVDWVIHQNNVLRLPVSDKSPLIQSLIRKSHAGLVLFSTGTTGRPKAILHDLTMFLKRYETPRPTLRTINFLLFDHIGGINTLFHTLFNKGIVVAPKSRTVHSILETCEKHSVEVLPTTPTFLRLLLMSGMIPSKIPSSLKIITYGTERMDQPTLDELCRLLPNVDFRQTFGMSELGIVRVKSESRNSLFMKIGGNGVETKVTNNILMIRSETRMEGYLNAASPFDDDGWYNTKDVVEVKGDWFKVIGRDSEVINVGGLKFMASEVERVAVLFPGVSLVKVLPKSNPITGQHVELMVEVVSGQQLDKHEFANFLKEKLQPHMVPRRIILSPIKIGHRYKRA